MKKIFFPSVLLIALAAGHAHAQLAGGNTTSDISGRNVSGGAPMAPGNPNTSTVVPDSGGRTASPYMTPDTSTQGFNSVMPSSGNAVGALSDAPSNMSLSQFRTYLRGRWGLNGNQSMTPSQWNNVDPAFFTQNKPSFSSLDVDRNGTLNTRELQPLYSRLYGEYKNPK